jgi:hypothetical protein
VIRTARLALALAVLGWPGLAAACASCISTPFGDQSYNWPYLVLILVPFAVGGVIGGIMVRVTGVRVADVTGWLTRSVHPAAREEETS